MSPSADARRLEEPRDTACCQRREDTITAPHRITINYPLNGRERERRSCRRLILRVGSPTGRPPLGILRDTSAQRLWGKDLITRREERRSQRDRQLRSTGARASPNLDTET